MEGGRGAVGEEGEGEGFDRPKNRGGGRVLRQAQEPRGWEGGENLGDLEDAVLIGVEDVGGNVGMEAVDQQVIVWDAGVEDGDCTLRLPVVI